MKIRELYSDKSKWTQHHSARDKDGTPTRCNLDAFSFCLYGALEVCYPELSAYILAENKIKAKLESPFIAVWNDADNRTFEEVKALVAELDI